MASDEDRRKRGRPATGKGKPVMLRLSPDLQVRLDEHARRRALAPATLARQLVKEGLDHLDVQDLTISAAQSSTALLAT